MKNLETKGLQSLLLGALVVLGACGEEPVKAPAPVPPTNTPSTVVPVTANTGDVVVDFLIPMMQAQYGDIYIDQQTTVGTIAVPVGRYTWIQFYTSYVKPMAGLCGCVISAAPASSSVWATVNWGSFSGWFGGYRNNLALARARFLVNGYAYTTDVYTIVNMLITYQYQYYVQYYYSVYPQWYGMIGTYQYPSSSISVGAAVNYNSESGLSISVGGLFNKLF